MPGMAGHSDGWTVGRLVLPQKGVAFLLSIDRIFVPFDRNPVPFKWFFLELRIGLEFFDVKNRDHVIGTKRRKYNREWKNI
jgi:hypothetical protein